MLVNALRKSPVTYNIITRKHRNRWEYIDGLVQDGGDSIANALELLQSCTKSSICGTYRNSCYVVQVTNFIGRVQQDVSLLGITLRWLLLRISSRLVMTELTQANQMTLITGSSNCIFCQEHNIRLANRIKIYWFDFFSNNAWPLYLLVWFTLLTRVIFRVAFCTDDIWCIPREYG